MQGNAGAAFGAGNGLGAEVTRATAYPAHAFAGGQPCAAAFNCDFVGHNKARIKANTKLADELRIGFLVASKPPHKVFGAAFGNGAQMLYGLCCAHAYAVIGDGDGFGGFVKAYTHLQIGLAFVQIRLRQGFKAQFVAGIRCVANQLAHENIGVGIQRVRNQVQQLGYFGLEGMGLGACHSVVKRKCKGKGKK